MKEVAGNILDGLDPEETWNGFTNRRGDLSRAVMDVIGPRMAKLRRSCARNDLRGAAEERNCAISPRLHLSARWVDRETDTRPNAYDRLEPLACDKNKCP